MDDRGSRRGRHPHMVLPGNKKFTEGDMPRAGRSGGKAGGAGEGDARCVPVRSEPR